MGRHEPAGVLQALACLASLAPAIGGLQLFEGADGVSTHHPLRFLYSIRNDTGRMIWILATRRTLKEEARIMKSKMDCGVMDFSNDDPEELVSEGLIRVWPDFAEMLSVSRSHAYEIAKQVPTVRVGGVVRVPKRVARRVMAEGLQMPKRGGL